MVIRNNSLQDTRLCAEQYRRTEECSGVSNSDWKYAFERQMLSKNRECILLELAQTIQYTRQLEMILECTQNAGYTIGIIWADT